MGRARDRAVLVVAMTQTLRQRQILAQAHRWAARVPVCRTQADKRRCVRRLCEQLKRLLGCC